MLTSELQTDLQLKRTCRGIDWKSILELYRISDFDNGRRPRDIRIAFENSYKVCFAIRRGDVIGTARAISDKICCAAIFDVCVHPDYRHQQVGSQIVKELLRDLGNQHIILTTKVPSFYQELGFQSDTDAMVLL